MATGDQFYREWEKRNLTSPPKKQKLPDWKIRGLLIIVIVGISCFAVAKNRELVTQTIKTLFHINTAKSSTLKTEIEKSDIEVFGPEGSMTTLAFEAAKLRSSHVHLHTITNLGDLQNNTELMTSLKQVGGIVNGGIKLPIIRVGNRVLSETEMNALYSLPGAYIAPEQSLPYIHVFGVENCGYTQNLIRDLKFKNANFQYSDMNQDQKLAAKEHARFLASMGGPAELKLPLVDVNGTVMSRPSAEDVLSHFKDFRR